MAIQPALPHHERITDPTFRHAVDLIDSGSTLALEQLLAANPTLIHQRVHFEEPAYFSDPTLLEFVAENPVRHGTLPPGIVAVATVLLEAGPEQASITSTLTLVASGRIARDSQAQAPLIELLCRHGADPAPALHTAAVHGEMEAIHQFLKQGAVPDLPTLAALGDDHSFLKALPAASPASRHLALALAAQYGRAAMARVLLASGEDPNRFNPEGAHSHSTPLHQAALAGHLDTIQVLLDHGADVTLKDPLWQGAPADWARHGGYPEIAALLDSFAR